jgi:hypothetical protein
MLTRLSTTNRRPNDPFHTSPNPPTPNNTLQKRDSTTQLTYISQHQPLISRTNSISISSNQLSCHSYLLALLLRPMISQPQSSSSSPIIHTCVLLLLKQTCQSLVVPSEKHAQTKSSSHAFPFPSASSRLVDLVTGEKRNSRRKNRRETNRQKEKKRNAKKIKQK